MDRRAFLDQVPPPGYIAGVGRGATGFVTGADTGALRNLRQFEDSDSENESNTNDVGILSTRLGKDDEEAERIYEAIEQKLLARSKTKTELVQDVKTDELDNKFTDLKRALTNVSRDEWANLPEAMDFTKRNKRMRILEQSKQRFYATPDNIIAAQSGMTNGKQTNTEQDDVMNNEEIELDNQRADIDRNRAILASLRKSEPFKASSWIASARLEIQAKKFNSAKKLISEGCKKNPHNESLWLENITIHSSATEGEKMAKIIVTEALRYNSKSEQLWLKAFELEHPNDITARSRVLMKGIDFIPDSVILWQKMIDIQDDKEDVKKMLTKVIELCPNEWSFWLSLINLQAYSEAKVTLNKARKIFKNSNQVWITGAKLEERENPQVSQDKITKLLTKAISEIEKNQTLDSIVLTIRDWLQEAAKAESEGFLLTCKAIVFSILSTEASNEDLWFQEASYFTNQESPKTALFIYEFVVDKYPTNINSWMRLFQAFKSSGQLKVQDIYDYYYKAIDLNPEQELFHLMLAKDKWKIEGDILGARDVLDKAIMRLPQKEQVWHAKIKFEVKVGNYKDAQQSSLQSLQEVKKTPSTYYKHIHLQRFMNSKFPTEDFESSILQTIDFALVEFPEEEKLYLQKGQILNDLGKDNEARDFYSMATKKLPSSINLWLSLSRTNESLNSTVRARSELDRAVIKNPESDILWVEKIKLERRSKNLVAARQLCAKALKAFNKSPYIWIEHLTLIPKMSQRKNAFLDALKSTDNSPIILLNIGIFFWVDGKISKAKSWFERALNSDSTNGDIWGWMYNFFVQHGTEVELKDFQVKFQKNEDFINTGSIWNNVSKTVENLDKDQLEILKLVADKLKQETAI